MPKSAQRVKAGRGSPWGCRLSARTPTPLLSARADAAWAEWRAGSGTGVADPSLPSAPPRGSALAKTFQPGLGVQGPGNPWAYPGTLSPHPHLHRSGNSGHFSCARAPRGLAAALGPGPGTSAQRRLGLGRARLTLRAARTPSRPAARALLVDRADPRPWRGAVIWALSAHRQQLLPKSSGPCRPHPSQGSGPPPATCPALPTFQEGGPGTGGRPGSLTLSCCLGQKRLCHLPVWKVTLHRPPAG